MQALIPTADAAKMLGLTPSGISRLVKRGQMDAAMRGPGKTGPMFFTPAEVGRVHVERMQNRSKVA